VNRLRWLILILGPWPILGSSWAVSAWFKSEPAAATLRNDALPTPPAEAVTLRAIDAQREADAACRSEPTHRLAADCAETAQRLANHMQSEARVLVRAPFVLAGDLDQAQLAAWYDGTIAPAVLAMRRGYFKTEPHQPVTILLFSNESSYNRYCQQLFGDAHISVFGYYKRSLRTVVLNISTGGGTLLHELTHALMDFDFPRAPDWLNEGLASLHEQYRFRVSDEGPWIEGLVNWRLPGLQELVRQERLRPVRQLLTDSDFRGPNEGVNYAHARYLCLYLQQRGVLEAFVKEFRAVQAQDPQGERSLAAALRRSDLDQLDRDFRQWVIELEAVDSRAAQYEPKAVAP